MICNWQVQQNKRRNLLFWLSKFRKLYSAYIFNWTTKKMNVTRGGNARRKFYEQLFGVYSTLGIAVCFSHPFILL